MQPRFDEVKELRSEETQLKEALAETSLKTRLQKNGTYRLELLRARH